MKKLDLTKYFSGVIAKRLSEVEVNLKKSNQQEFNATSAMKELLGSQKRQFSTQFIYLCDEADPVIQDGSLTWYDARESNPLRSEFRLFYTKTAASDQLMPGDSLFLCRKKDEKLLAVFTRRSSMMEKRMNWLFGIKPANVFLAGDLKANDGIFLLSENWLLRHLGINTYDASSETVWKLHERFSARIPSFAELTCFSRELSGISPADGNADEVLMSWMNIQERVVSSMQDYMTGLNMAKILGSAELRNSFFSMRDMLIGNWQNAALMNHLQPLLKNRNLKSAEISKYGMNYLLLPGLQEQDVEIIPQEQVSAVEFRTVLDKDTFRSVRDEQLHYLITLDPGITPEQTKELKEGKLQLVVPLPVQKLYNNKNAFWFLSVEELLLLLTEKQEGRYGN